MQPRSALRCQLSPILRLREPFLNGDCERFGGGRGLRGRLSRREGGKGILTTRLGVGAVLHPPLGLRWVLVILLLVQLCSSFCVSVQIIPLGEHPYPESPLRVPNPSSRMAMSRGVCFLPVPPQLSPGEQRSALQLCVPKPGKVPATCQLFIKHG